MSSELIHRLHFAFTITFHYLFPQLTMGLGLLIVVLKSVALKTQSQEWNRAARFWGKIFAINFVLAWLPVFRWSLNSALTGRASPTCPAV